MAKQDISKEIRYLNRDFPGLRNALIDFAKVYFPHSYNDFNETSPGMMFIEMAAYAGDVLSYYMDAQIKETMIPYAEERENVLAIAQDLGYPVRATFPATTLLNVWQLVPSVGEGIDIRPDMRFALILESGMEVTSELDPTVTFRTIDRIDFRQVADDKITIFERDSETNYPTWYLLEASAKVVAGTVKTQTFHFGDPQKYVTVTLPKTDITELISVVDADGNVWHQVPYLAQETVFEDIENLSTVDPDLAQYSDEVPYLLRLRRTARRFITRLRSDNKTEMQFGAGISQNPDELIVPNPELLQSTRFKQPVNPANFMFTNVYGQVPHNTTLTVTYAHGGGVKTNVPQNTLTVVSKIEINDDFVDIPGELSGMLGVVRDSIAVNNPEPATGGKGSEDIEVIRNNALAFFSAQDRAVTKEDYIVRAYSMPARFGSVSKVYIVPDDQLNYHEWDQTLGRPNSDPNPLALNLYCLGFDVNKKLTQLNIAVKENLKTYLSQYRMLTDAINIKDGHIINIGVEFSIIVFKNHNKKEVLLRAINEVKKFVDIEKWQFNQPIILSDLSLVIANVEGVQSVTDVRVTNKYDQNDGYSGNIYDINAATRGGIVYPSVDPAVFEVRFPNKDIVGNAI